MRPARLLTLIALLTGLLSAMLPTLPAAASDNYPWRTDATWTADSWGFTKRQCVSFAAFRLALAGHPIVNSTGNWGSAAHWDDAAVAHHLTVSRMPAIGTIAQWNGYERSGYWTWGSLTMNGTIQAGGWGHVGVVTYVYPDRSVKVEQYNINGTRSWSVMRAYAPRYLYIR